MTKAGVLRFTVLTAVLCTAVLCSCGGYKEPPFDGMEGRVQKVTIFHIMPEMWHAGSKSTDVMYVNESIYDFEGNEICSAVMDSALRVQSLAESYFENGICKRSTQKAGSRTIASLNLISVKNGVLEYSKELNGHVARIKVKETSFMRRHKSVITEDGVVITKSIIQTNRKGLPVKITTIDMQTGSRIVETNIYNESGNVIEKHTVTKEAPNSDEKEDIRYIEYGDLDEYGNWKTARTYNKVRLPEEVLVREFEYWK